MTHQVLVVYNPTSKSQRQTEEWMGKLVGKLNSEDHCLVSFYPTTERTRPPDLAPLLPPSLKLVIAAGGDGSIRIVLGALAMRRSPVPAALLPIGTGNVLARNLGIVENRLLVDPLQNFYDYLVNGVPRRIDLGMMNGEFFGGMAGVGPLADAFTQPKRHEKTKTKLLAYMATLLASIAEPPRYFKITTSGWSFKIQASGIFIGNVDTLGIGAAPDLDSLQDGLLTLHVINPVIAGDYLELVKRYAGGCRQDNPADWYFPIKEALVETVPRRSHPSPFQLQAVWLRKLLSGKPPSAPRRGEQLACMIDGDICGCTPMRVTVIPSAVNILVPPEAAADLPPGLTLRSTAPDADRLRLAAGQ
jgi:diacylglycerol kinase (ATP)